MQSHPPLDTAHCQWWQAATCVLNRSSLYGVSDGYNRYRDCVIPEAWGPCEPQNLVWKRRVKQEGHRSRRDDFIGWSGCTFLYPAEAGKVPYYIQTRGWGGVLELTGAKNVLRFTTHVPCVCPETWFRRPSGKPPSGLPHQNRLGAR